MREPLVWYMLRTNKPPMVNASLSQASVNRDLYLRVSTESADPDKSNLIMPVERRLLRDASPKIRLQVDGTEMVSVIR